MFGPFGSPEKRPQKQENGFAVYSLCAITQTKKQTIGLQVYIVIIYNDDDNNINYKKYLHGEPQTPCGKMTHK